MQYRPCEQKKCSLLGTIMCPDCPDCHAGSGEVSKRDTCVPCWCCEKDEGYVRDKVPDNLKDLLKAKMKRMLEQLKQQEEQQQRPQQPIIIQRRY